MFLAALYGSNAPITLKMRSAARDQLLAAMAADLAEETEDKSDQLQSRQAEVDNVGAGFRIAAAEVGALAPRRSGSSAGREGRMIAAAIAGLLVAIGTLAAVLWALR